MKDVIGLTFMDSTVLLDAAESININYATGGKVDETKLTLPAGLTLDTAPAGSTKTVRDLLNGIGFNLWATMRFSHAIGRYNSLKNKGHRIIALDNAEV